MSWYDFLKGPAKAAYTGAKGLASGVTDRLSGLANPGRGYDTAAKGAADAAAAAQNLSTLQWQRQQEGLKGALSELGGARDIYGQLFGPGGRGAGPTYSEQLYGARQGGIDPYTAMVGREMGRNLDTSLANRGGFNSGAAALGHARLDEGLAARLYQQQADLAHQADSARMGQLGQQFGGALDLGRFGAGLYGGFYGQGGQYSGQAMTDAINAQANAAGLRGQGQQARDNQFMDIILGLAKLK